MASKGPECASSPNANGMPPADESSPSTGPVSPAMGMSPDSTPNGSENIKYNYRLTEEDKQEAVRRYEAGESVGAIAEDYPVTRQSMWDTLRRRTKMRDRLEALPRLTEEERSKVQAKRNRALKRYRARAARITRPQIQAVKERDKVCLKCGAPGVDIDHIVPVMKGGQTEMDNLQLLCKPCHVDKSRTDWKGVSRKEASQSISSAEAFRNHARTSQLPVNERDLMENEASCSTRQPESLTLFSGTEDGCSLRTFPDSFPRTVAETSLPFSRRWPNSGFTTSLGECWTADTSECPRGGGGFSSLPDVLEGIVPDRFYLSPKAAAGILRRSQKRERELPVALLDALMILSARYKAEESADTESEQKQPQGANS